MKTLKDMNYFELESPEGETPEVKAEVYVSCDCGKSAKIETIEPARLEEVPIETPLIKREELKQEAINWIKELRRQWKNHAVAVINGKEWPYCKELIDWVIENYNITEEDLK